MYQALYRKYRPQTFSDLCGQAHITQTIKTQIAQGRQSHAYLFTGSRGTGKTSSAKILAKAVNCPNNQSGEPCNECEICHSIDAGTILDVKEIDAASNNRVNDIRELRDEVEYSPSQVKYRVYIIDEVHMLTNEASNALLKTLEEPPKHVLFILATTEVWSIPATILSRCQRYDFNRIAADIIANRIKFVCEKEDISIEDTAATLIAKLADGGLRDALSILDLCAGFAKEITEKTVAECVGLVGRSYLFELVDLIEAKDAGNILEKLNELYSASCDMERLCTELISHYRDLLVAKTTSGFKSLITATNEELELIENQAKKIKFEHIVFAIDRLTECLENMKKGAPKRTSVETAFIRLCNPKLDSSINAILARVSNLELGVTISAPITQAPATQPVAKPSVVQEAQNEFIPKSVRDNLDKTDSNQTTPQAEKIVDEELEALLNELSQDDSADFVPKEPEPPKAETQQNENNEIAVPFNNWPEVLELLRKNSPMIRGFLDNSKAYIRGKYLLIDAPNSQFAQMINGDTSHKQAIRNAVTSVTGSSYLLGPYKRKTNTTKDKGDPLEAFINEFQSDIVIE